MDKPPYLTDYWTTEDALQYSDFRNALARIVRGAATPLTVGVFGPWGSGKTSLLRMVQKAIDGDNLQSERTVWFTSWKYDRHEALWRAFILRVLDAFYPRVSGEEERENRPRVAIDDLSEEQQERVRYLNRLTESLYRPVEWEELGDWTMQWGQAGVEIAKLPAFLLLLAARAENTADKLGIIPDLTHILEQETYAHRMEQLASMEQFEHKFQDLVQDELGNDGRLIVFVDDLDRCLPERAIEVLEAMKLFLEVHGTVFVLGMDKEVVERGVEVRYDSLFREIVDEGDSGREELPIRGNEYLQKIVQIPFHLPPLSVDRMEAYLRHLESQIPYKYQTSEMTRKILARSLYPNPRQAKRAINIFQLLREIARNREERGQLPVDSVSDPLLAKTILIQTQHPKLYSDWRQFPPLVRYIEEECSRPAFTYEESLQSGSPAGSDRKGLSSTLRKHLKEERVVRMLQFPTTEQAENCDERVRFEGLDYSQMATYVHLAETVGITEAPQAIPGNILFEILSGDQSRLLSAVRQARELEDDLLNLIRRELVRMMHESKRSALERVNAGLALELLGDPRSELVSSSFIEFRYIQPGKFLAGEKQIQVEIPYGYWISRYPVTRSQFAEFAESTNKIDNHPTEEQLRSTRPVTEVSWNEALEFCEWLSSQFLNAPPKRVDELGKEEDKQETSQLWNGLRNEEIRILLPSEIEWEKAARGEDGRIYPWGDKPDPNSANYSDTGIGETSVIGCFSQGASIFEVEEVSGNVWEWTRSVNNENYPYSLDKMEREKYEDLDAKQPRTIRGGSFTSPEQDIRCAARYSYYPNQRQDDCGFRVAAIPKSCLGV